ncbi:MAG: hypothetical protein AAGG46_01700 [Planctomycetota bacterium]
MLRINTYLGFAVAGIFAAGSADAQLVTYYSPVIGTPVVAAPAPVVVAAPVPTVVARPVATVVARPVATVATVVARPVTTVVARPVATVAYSPVAVAPAPVVAPTVVASPVVTNVPVYTTRYRPLLGGSVTRVRYRPMVTTAYYAAY